MPFNTVAYHQLQRVDFANVSRSYGRHMRISAQRTALTVDALPRLSQQPRGRLLISCNRRAPMTRLGPGQTALAQLIPISAPPLSLRARARPPSHGAPLNQSQSPPRISKPRARICDTRFTVPNPVTPSAKPSPKPTPSISSSPKFGTKPGHRAKCTPLDHTPHFHGVFSIRSRIRRTDIGPWPVTAPIAR
jgi:hypothetical protein